MSVQITTLLRPPVKTISEDIAKEAVDSHFRSIDDLENLEDLVNQARTKYEDLSKAVRPFACLYSTTFQPSLVA